MSDFTVVLVHGAFAGSASGDGVIARSQPAGGTAAATPNPLLTALAASPTPDRRTTP